MARFLNALGQLHVLFEDFQKDPSLSGVVLLSDSLIGDLGSERFAVDFLQLVEDLEVLCINEVLLLF